MEARIRVKDGPVDELYSLQRWLQDEDALRGRVAVVSRPPGDEQMGGLPEMLSLVIGSGGLSAVLSNALPSWLSRNRRSAITVELVSGNTSRRVDIDAGNAAEALRLLRAAGPGQGGPD